MIKFFHCNLLGLIAFFSVESKFDDFGEGLHSKSRQTIVFICAALCLAFSQSQGNAIPKLQGACLAHERKCLTLTSSLLSNASCGAVFEVTERPQRTEEANQL